MPPTVPHPHVPMARRDLSRGYMQSPRPFDVLASGVQFIFPCTLLTVCRSMADGLPSGLQPFFMMTVGSRVLGGDTAEGTPRPSPASDEEAPLASGHVAKEAQMLPSRGSHLSRNPVCGETR